jgi:predicted porin
LPVGAASVEANLKWAFIPLAAILSFASAAHAGELSDIRDQAKQLREQNAAMTKRLAEIEKRQKALEAQRQVVPAINPVDAMAADLPYKAATKAKTAENDDICIRGICVYGNFDMGLSYIQHSAALNAFAAAPLGTIISKNASGAYFGTGPNQMSNSYIGLRGKQEIADNLFVVFNLQTLFNVNNGLNANGIGSVAQNNGLTTAPLLQNAFADSSKGGQMFNGAAYFGISSPNYGTFTMGRQTALSSDLLALYDPLVGSNSWSLLTFQGANGGGGDTEDRIFDNSYEYRVSVGPVRLAAIAQLRNGGNSSTGNAFQGTIGFDYMGFSMDFLGGKIYDAVSASPLSPAQLAASISTVATSNGLLAGTVSDNTVFQVGAKYVIGPWKFYGGYENIHFANPDNPLAPGAFVTGGYILGAGGAINNTNFTNERVLQTGWAGVKYAITPTLDITGAYYHQWQNSFATGANTGCTDARASQCSGSLDMVSLALDWRFAKHVDMYAGVAWSQVQNGLASGFLLANGTSSGTTIVGGPNKASSYDPGIGLRYQF